jgi:hypothetical protein
MLTIFSLPKAFAGHIGVIQRNAIMTWARLEPQPAIVLLGKDEGTAEMAQAVGARHIADVATNARGTPLLSDVLRRAREISQTPLTCLVNCDIILLQEFLDGVTKVARELPRFLAVAQRLNIKVSEPLDFTTTGERKFRCEVLRAGLPGSHTAIDVFVFPSDVYREVPPLVLGRAWFDQWLIKEARHQGVAVVDISRCAQAIHQDHDYGHIANGQRGAYWGEEALGNLAIYGGVPHAYTLLSATHELCQNGTIRKVHLRETYFAVKQAMWNLFVRRTVDVRDKLGLRRKFRHLSKSVSKMR